MGHVSVHIWRLDLKFGICSFVYRIDFWLNHVCVWVCVWANHVTPTLCSSVALIPLLKDNRKPFGKDPMQTVCELLNSLSLSFLTFLSPSEECLAQQIPISSTPLMILIVSVIMYWSVLCVGCVLHTSLSGVIRECGAGVVPVLRMLIVSVCVCLL